MANPRIVLLGDCIATGQDLLWPEITGEKDFIANPVECVKNEDFQKKLMMWFLKNNSEKIDLKNLLHLSYKLKIKKEKGMSWASHLPNCLNLAVAGESFQGMHKKLKKLIEDKNQVDHVLITDFSATHRCVVVNQRNQKHVIKRDINFLELPQDIWPAEAYDEFVQKVHSQETKGFDYQKRKNKKSYQILTRLLEQHNIPFRFLLFRKDNNYLTTEYVDMTDLADKYTDADTGNVVCAKKLAVQVDIAERLRLG